MKFLLFLVLLAVIWWIWKKPARRPPSLPTAAAPERMVTCQHCHVHLPESESLAAGEVFYCCEAHRAAGPSAKP